MFKISQCYIVLMKTSVNLYFEKNIDTKTKMNTIKALGYDEFFTGIYDKEETLTFAEQMQYAQEIGLPCTMVHCAYYEPGLNDFWLPGEAGEKITDDYIQQIHQCGNLTKNFVVHLHGSFASTTSEIGLRRLKRILKVCEKYGLNLCIENVFSATEIPYIFSHIQHPLLKICYDTGHRNYLTPSFSPCENYAQFVAVLHLHENDGSYDQHNMLTINGSIFNQLKYELDSIKKDVVLTAELKNIGKDWQTYLQKNLDSLRRLNEFIRKDRV